MTVHDLPTVNAILNSVAAVFLVLGRKAAKRSDRVSHTRWMIAALVCSAAFLACYLYYHAHVLHTPYEGQGILRTVYFIILASHVPLAGLMVPFIIAAVILAALNKIEAHRKLVRWVWPVWIYVSVTGVLIYLMLYVF